MPMKSLANYPKTSPSARQLPLPGKLPGLEVLNRRFYRLCKQGLQRFERLADQMMARFEVFRRIKRKINFSFF